MSAAPPGGARPLAGRTYLITGATSGIGKEAAAQLAGLGATVVFGVRSRGREAAALAELRRRDPAADLRPGPAPLDLASLASVRAFVDAWKAWGLPLHCLVANAGANHVRGRTPDGFAALAQVNHLAPYALLRGLEGALAAGAAASGRAARVVAVSSVMHRDGVLPADPAEWLAGERSPRGQRRGGGDDYAASKLANAATAFEAGRRLRAAGVAAEAAAVDPGGVATAIWDSSPAFAARAPLGQLVRLLYAPPADGAAAVVHAASVGWAAEAAEARRVAAPMLAAAEGAGGGGGPRRLGRAAAAGRRGAAGEDPGELRFYARGAFAWPGVTRLRGAPSAAGWLDPLDAPRRAAWAVAALAASALDWPLRSFTGGRWPARVALVPAAPAAYDGAAAAALWDASADAVGAPRGCAV